MSAAATTVRVVDERCTACGACLVTCPQGALLPAPRRPVVAESLCTACLDCVEICPRGAIEEVPLRAGWGGDR